MPNSQVKKDRKTLALGAMNKDAPKLGDNRQKHAGL